MKLFLAGVLALALGTGASLFYEWTLYPATMERMQTGWPPPADKTAARAVARNGPGAGRPNPARWNAGRGPWLVGIVGRDLPPPDDDIR